MPIHLTRIASYASGSEPDPATLAVGYPILVDGTLQVVNAAQDGFDTVAGGGGGGGIGVFHDNIDPLGTIFTSIDYYVDGVRNLSTDEPATAFAGAGNDPLMTYGYSNGLNDTFIFTDYEVEVDAAGELVETIVRLQTPVACTLSLSLRLYSLANTNGTFTVEVNGEAAVTETTAGATYAGTYAAHTVVALDLDAGTNTINFKHFDNANSGTGGWKFEAKTWQLRGDREPYFGELFLSPYDGAPHVWMGTHYERLRHTVSDKNSGAVSVGPSSMPYIDYDSGVAVGKGAHIVPGPSDWGDAVAVGDDARASGEAIAIGPGVEAYNYAAISLADYPSGLPATADIGIGGYINFGGFDQANVTPLTPPSIVVTPQGTGDVFKHPDIQMDYRVTLIKNTEQAVSANGFVSGITQGNMNVNITLNNANGAFDEVQIHRRIRFGGTYEGEWRRIHSVSPPAGDFLLVDDGIVGRPDAPVAGWFNSGTEAARVMIGYSAAQTDTSVEAVGVGAFNALNHERVVLLGSNLTSDKAYQVKPGGPNHVMTAPGGVEFRTQTVTSAKTIDGAGTPGTAKETVILANATSGAYNVTLPAVASGRTVIVKKIDASANAVTVVPASGTIDGAANSPLASQYAVVRLVSDGTNWFKI